MGAPSNCPPYLHPKCCGNTSMNATMRRRGAAACQEAACDAKACSSMSKMDAAPTRIEPNAWRREQQRRNVDLVEEVEQKRQIAYKVK